MGSASGGREGVTLAMAREPDVVLMDLEMPDLDGAAATRETLRQNTGAKVVVLTSFGDRSRILEALDAGAIGYLLKDAEPEELVRAVKAAANGDAPLDPRAAREVLAEQRDRPAAPDLSEREREILTLVAHGHANKARLAGDDEAEPRHGRAGGEALAETGRCGSASATRPCATRSRPRAARSAPPTAPRPRCGRSAAVWPRDPAKRSS